MGNQKKSSSQLLKLGVVITLIFSFSSCDNETEIKAEYDVTIAESEEGTWRLYDEEENDMGTITVNPGDRITWNAPNSNVVFGFSLDMEKYFELKEGQFTETDDSLKWPENDNTDSNERRIQEVPAGETLSLSVSEDSPEATIDYDIYVVDEGEFVVGNSPPYVVIQRPHE